MKAFVKSYWKAILLFALAGLVGGFMVGLFVMDSYPQDIQQQILDQGIDRMMLGVISAVQAAGYGLVLGALGIALAKKTGLWKDEISVERKSLCAALVVSAFGGLVMILADTLVFGRFSQAIADSYKAKPSAVFVLGSVIYGGVIEEVMLRLFLMSLIAFVLHKIAARGEKQPAAWMIAAANVISALLFAAGHLPATQVLMGLTPMIVLRCFLLNGGIGLLFGGLYSRYGLHYAMIAHAGCHVVSKLIWILFL